MATAISARPALPPKMKRPPPPSVQTTVNGVKSTQPSLSPSLGSKRPPGAFKQPPSATVASGLNGATNGSASRSSVRRKESQKLGDSSGRPSRSVRSGQGEVNKIATKRMPEPYGVYPTPLLSTMVEHTNVYIKILSTDNFLCT